jgi:predicted peptidase
MPVKLFLILTIVVFLIAGLRVQAVPGQAGANPAVPVLSPGAYNRSLRTADLAIGYAIAIPANYTPAKSVPLILALHFGGNPNGAGSSLLNILVRPALEELGAIIVAPDSIGGQWSTAENERAVNLLVDGVMSSYNIDEKRIAVTGFSMGGAGTWHFADKYPDRFSAAIPVAGRPTPSAAGWRVPVMAIHSRQDEVVPIGPAEARIAELQKAGVRAEMIVLTGITHYQTNRFVDGLRKAVPWLKEVWK